MFMFIVLGLLGCRQSKPAGCSSTQAVLSGPAAQNLEPQTPAGGYINFADRACTSTLLLESATSETLTVNAYAASHCAPEFKSDNPSVSLTVFIPRDAMQLPGYLKNIPAKDDFFERRKAFMSEVRSLGNAAAEALARKSTEITFYNETDSALDPSNGLPLQGYCTQKTSERPKLKGFESVPETCWSSSDTNVRVLTISKSEIGESKFQLLKSHLEERKNAHLQSLLGNKQLSEDFKKLSSHIRVLQGANRLDNYRHIALFLNENLCPTLGPSDVRYQACSVREKLQPLVEKYLVETDFDGNSKSILKKLDELGIGIKSPYHRTVSEPGPGGTPLVRNTNIGEIFRENVSDKVIDKYFENEIPFNYLGKGATPSSLRKWDPQISLAANVTYNSDGERISLFSLVKNTTVFGSAENIPGFFTELFQVVFHLTQTQSKIAFDKTDSGTMLTLGGIAPLYVLQSVDREPVSGGASILALPEAEPEVVPASTATLPGKTGTVASRPASKSATTGAEVADKDAIVAQGNYQRACF